MKGGLGLVQSSSIVRSIVAAPLLEPFACFTNMASTDPFGFFWRPLPLFGLDTGLLRLALCSAAAATAISAAPTLPLPLLLDLELLRPSLPAPALAPAPAPASSALRSASPAATRSSHAARPAGSSARYRRIIWAGE